MRLLSFRALVLIATICFASLVARSRIERTHGQYASKFNTQLVRRALVKKVLEQDHTFVSANDPRFNYIGRWVPTINHLRRDAGFPGAYMEFVALNASSVYLQLRNARTKHPQTSGVPVQASSSKLVVLPGRSRMAPSPPVSLLVEINGKSSLHFEDNAQGILALLGNGGGPVNFSVKATMLPCSGTSASTLELEGLWLSNGGYLGSSRNHTAAPVGLTTSVSIRERLIEVVRPSSSHDPAWSSGSYASLLAATFNGSHNLLAVPYCLTTVCNSQTTMSEVYFRSGLASTPHYSLPHTFPSLQPSALVLELGLLDYQHFLSASPSTHAMTQFNHKFVEAFVSFVKTLRAYAYPYHSRTSSTGSMPVDQLPGLSGGLDYGASFTYNSAPSTLPIFLLTPFTPDKRLRRLLSHTISETVNRLQKEGDRSTFWLDTSNWLQRDDFIPSSIDKANDQMQTPEFTPAAHRKIATYLSLHLCPYLDDNGRENCPFHKFDNYLGHLYKPDEVSMGRLLEERKINLIRNALGLDWV